MSTNHTEIREDTASENSVKDSLPPMYKVLLHNDNYTSMEFVIEILIFVFHKSNQDATKIMLNVHEQGVGVCGIFTCEVAETKVDSVHTLARDRKFPLKCSMEKE